jgi:hypothetical protein
MHSTASVDPHPVRLPRIQLLAANAGTRLFLSPRSCWALQAGPGQLPALVNLRASGAPRTLLPPLPPASYQDASSCGHKQSAGCIAFVDGEGAAGAGDS